MRNLRSVTLGVVLALVAGVAVGCAGQPPAPQSATPPSTTATPQAAAPAQPAAQPAQPAPQAQPAKKAPVKVSVVTPGNSMTFWPFIIGVQKGFFAAEGLEIDHILVSSSTAAIQTVSSGSAHVSQSAAEATILAVEKGAKLAIVSGGVNIPMYSLVGQPEIKSVADLKGKLLAVTGPNTGETPIMLEILRKNGLQTGDYELISAGFTRERFAALQKKAVAAGLLTSPYEYMAFAEGFSELAFVPDVIDYYQYTSTTMDRNWMEKNPEAAVGFLRAWLKALRWLQDPKNRPEGIQIYAEVGKVKPEFVAQGQERYISRAYPANGEVSVKGMEKVISELTERGVLKSVQPVSKYVDNILLSKALATLKS